MAGGTPIAYFALQHLGAERVLEVPADDICDDNVVTTAGGLGLMDRDHAEAITLITGQLTPGDDGGLSGAGGDDETTVR